VRPRASHHQLEQIEGLYDGENVYVLSDQKTPAEYADQKVKVTGKLDESSKTIQVEKIEPVK